MSGGLIYEYDGSFEGFLCCVFESFEKREMPDAIVTPEQEQETLFSRKVIAADGKKADRVFQSIPRKISGLAGDLVRKGFLTCLEEKELVLLRFLRLGFHYGAPVTDMLQNDTVSTLQKAVKFLENESHLTKEFLRFSVFGESMAAEIEPKNFVLPLLAPHFCSRFYWQNFLIYDSVHGAALVHSPGEDKIIPVESISFPAPDREEREYRELWRQFYRTAANESRCNPRCRMTHMPKHYWKHMTEFTPEPDPCAPAALPPDDGRGPGLIP